MFRRTKQTTLMAGLSSLVVCVFVLVEIAQAQSQATTDPSEVSALNSVFHKWGLLETKNWNISGEPCSGVAIDGTLYTNPDYNPLIKCDCSETTCHIAQLKAFALNVVGPIPDELWTLTYLNNLDLRENSLTGSISPSIGNLTRLQYLSFGINSLSGEVPKEFGKLTDLRSLAFGTNYFSGQLPSEIGNLSKLEQLYIASSGVSGEIPSTFANLKSLRTVWIFDTELRGKIPDFIGNWTNLTALRLFGNGFDGPIPSTFSNLNSLTDLRVGDLTNGSSSLAFIKNMKSLTILVLRNSNISGSIPSDIGEYQSLARLDLSFNNLSGQIPESLFNLSSLSYLFLGNNKLTGPLPSQKSPSLLNIDLSYNKFSGSFPSWVSQQNLQLNLVANNFTVGRSSKSSSLPSRLNCLQQNFPCNRGSGRYYNFAINCGGPQSKSSNKIVFERDNEALGPATYYVTDTERWAVSSVGLFAESNNPLYTMNTSQQIANTVDSELFQTARISPGSLRYYGLGLENGDYNVTLQFAELAFDPSTWGSHGRRAFDIYIQGMLKLKNFDIRKEAGGISYRAVQKEFKALVSENYLEIHLFWAGKGSCCVPVHGTYGPSLSAIIAVPDFKPTVSNKPPAKKNNKTGLIVGSVVSVVAASFVSVFLVFYLVRRRLTDNEDDELLGIDAKPYTFSYSELKTASGDFNSVNKLGEGGFGPVYKGTLSDGRVVAVKQLAVASQHGKSQFVAEIATVSAVQHRNLVKLYGCCIEGDNRLLVYEYLENKSLDQALFGKRSLHLNWATRYDICLGVARGLAYLHEESRLRIVHRDVKASNILLDSDLTPKLSDFGLAKLYDDQKTHISTRVAGTIGYLAPEYAMRGHLTEKADVFSFGVLALEIVSGRRNFDSNVEEERMYLLDWAWHLHENDWKIELVDSELSDFKEEEVKRVVDVALLCTQASPMLRPPMSRVVAMLLGNAEIGTVTTRPDYLTDLKFNDMFTSSFMSGTTQTATPDNTTSIPSDNITVGR